MSDIFIEGLIKNCKLPLSMNQSKNCKDHVVLRLKSYRRENIIFTDHVLIRLAQRQLNEEEIIANILNPLRLEYAIREEPERIDEEKFDCYFGYSNNLCHRYVLALKDDIIVVTAIKINRRWQIIAEKKLLSK